MITFSDKQRIEIQTLNPKSDSKFKYNVDKWSKLDSKYKKEIHEFENKEINRQDIINCFNDFYKEKSSSFIKPFLLTMVWGFSDTGYGTHRTNNYLSSESNIKLIEEAILNIKNGEKNYLEKSFNALKRIKGLGISYLTKVLYFATKAKGIDEYALIFDNRVAASIVMLTTSKEIHDIVIIQPSSKFKNYKKYNDLIHALAKKNDVSAEQIEMYLFNQIF
jgi:hypothetical protein